MSRLILLSLFILSSIGITFISVQMKEESKSPFVFQIIASGCKYQPDKVRFLTGFHLKGLDGVITALHGVVGCEIIQVRADLTTTANDIPGIYKLDSADVTHDIALLRPAANQSEQFLDSEGYEYSTDYEANEQILVLGHPRGTSAQLSSRSLIIRDTPTITLTKLIGDDAMYNDLLERKSPDLNIGVISIEGQLEPGHSGAPILSAKDNKVIGVVNGGLSGGESEVVWGIPWKTIELQPFDVIKSDLERLSTYSSTLFYDVASQNDEQLQNEWVLVIDIPDLQNSRSFTATLSKYEVDFQSRLLGVVQGLNLNSAIANLRLPDNNSFSGPIEQWIEFGNRWFRIDYIDPILMVEVTGVNPYPSSSNYNYELLVFDADTNKPIGGVTVEIQGEDSTMSEPDTTDGNGRFTFKHEFTNGDQAEIRIWISSDCYKYNERQTITKRSMKLNNINIRSTCSQTPVTETPILMPTFTPTIVNTPFPTPTPTFMVPKICISPNRTEIERLATYCKTIPEEIDRLNPDLPNLIEIDTVIVIPTSTSTNVPQ